MHVFPLDDGLPEELWHILAEGAWQRMVLEGWNSIGPSEWQHCWDFPSAVLHRANGCPRYAGGVCHPRPMPMPPFNDPEVRSAIYGYLTIILGKMTRTERIPVPDGGTTDSPDVVQDSTMRGYAPGPAADPFRL